MTTQPMPEIIVVISAIEFINIYRGLYLSALIGFPDFCYCSTIEKFFPGVDRC